MGNFLSKNLLLITVSLACLAAALGPMWGLGWTSPAIIPWAALILFLLTVGLWRLVRPLRSYPKDDFLFVIPLMLAVNLTGALLGPDRHWLQPMYYLLVALCALYYPIGFNLTIAGLIFLLEGANLVFMRGTGGVGSGVSMAVFGAYLSGTAIVLGRIFQSEHRKKEKAMRTVRRLQEGAHSLSPGGDSEEAVSRISPEDRAASLVEKAALLDEALSDLLATAGAAIPSENALLFMAGSGGENLYLRVHWGRGEVLEDCVVPVGQGLVGWAAKEKKPLLVSERARGLGYLRDETGAKSFVAAPILNGGVLEGVIALDSSQPGAFTEPDREALIRFAGIAMYLLQNAREYQQADLTAKNFAALHRISAEVSSSLDINTILDRLAELSRDILPYDYLTISLIEKGEGAGEGNGETVSFKTLKGYDGAALPKGTVPVTGSLLGWIVEQRQPLSFTDLDHRVDKLPVFPAKELRADFRSFIGLPLISQDNVLGVFTLALRAPDAISAYQQHMLSITANQAAVSIQNARLHQMMQQMATTDGLTGLINHRHFQERADVEFARATRYPEPLSLLLFDIDHFKKVNDTYGHPVGDAVLKKVARILKDAVRAADIAARYGGEEFVALLLNTDKKGAEQMAERIRAAVEKGKFLIDGAVIPVTISVGFAAWPEGAQGKKDLIEKADQALYWAKGHGRNRSCGYDAISGAGVQK